MKKTRKSYHSILLSLFLVIIIPVLSQNVSALSNQFATTSLDERSATSLKTKAANSIYFFEKCSPGKGTLSSGACGDNAKEIYWSVLSRHFEPIQVAGIFGNIDSEGSFGPTKWEYRLVPSPGASFQNHSFDELYNWPPCNSTTIPCAGGVGAFQITSALGPYLQYVNEKAPDLLDYFKDTKYSANGDEVLKIMPKEDFIQLVELEISYVMDVHLDKSAISNFKSLTDPGDAARWWSVNYEKCGNGCTDWNSSHNDGRAAWAKQEYETMKNFTCSSSSYSTLTNSDSNSDSDDSKKSDTKKNDTSAPSGITWIGDSYSVAANTKGLISKNFSDVDFGSGSPDTASSNIKSSKFVSKGSNDNPSCLSILKNIIDSNELRQNLVFACGTNGGWTDSDIKTFKKLLKDKDTKVVVVNSKIPGNDYADSNKRLKKLADDNDNISLADWVSVYSDNYFKTDSIHPYDDPGFEKWVESIADALGNAKSSCSKATYSGDYPSYPQCGSSWSNESYGSGKTMCDASCGASSMAMLATVAAGQDILPTDVRDLLGDSYYWNTSGSGMSALDKKVGEKYGFEVQDVPYSSLSDAEKKMKQYLDDGYMLHFSGKGSYPFSSGGHYIGVFGWSDKDAGKVMLANSGGYGNKEESLHDVIHAGLHGGSFSAIKNNKSNKCPLTDTVCPPENTDDSPTIGNMDVLKSVQEIIELANKNGSTYTWGGGHTTDSSVFDAMLNGSPINVDCTGFASLVMYKTFGKMTSFTSQSIFTDSLYEEVPRSDVRPGDVFAYNSPSGHGGIVIEASNGKVTKIAESGGTEGRSGKNTNIGYSGSSDFSVTNSNSANGHFFRFKGV